MKVLFIFVEEIHRNSLELRTSRHYFLVLEEKVTEYASCFG